MTIIFSMFLGLVIFLWVREAYGYFAALCNRVGAEDRLTFAGESFVVGPDGAVLARGDRLEEDLVMADLELEACARSAARTLFLPDRRPELYRGWLD